MTYIDNVSVPCYKGTFRIPYSDYMDVLQRGLFETTSRLKNGSFEYVHEVCAKDRSSAIRRICNWYWERYKGLWGQAHVILTVADPFEEVQYGPKFNCSDRTNRYLDSETLDRLLANCNDELEVETVEGGKAHHPKNSVKRKKRRRVYLENIGEGLYQHPNTKVMYYRETIVPQITCGGTKGNPGKFVQKRKVKDHKLLSKSTDKAIREVEARFGTAIELG